MMTGDDDYLYYLITIFSQKLKWKFYNLLCVDCVYITFSIKKIIKLGSMIANCLKFSGTF